MCQSKLVEAVTSNHLCRDRAIGFGPMATEVVAANLSGTSLYSTTYNQTSNEVIRLYIAEIQSLELQYTSIDPSLCQLPKLYTRTVPNWPDRRNRVPELRRPTVGATPAACEVSSAHADDAICKEGPREPITEASRDHTRIICCLKIATVIINSTTIFNNLLPVELGKTFNRHLLPIFAVFPSYKYSVLRPGWYLVR